MIKKAALIVVENEVSVPDQSSKKVFDRLKARDEERAVEVAKRSDEASTAADPRESVNAFFSDFSKSRQTLEAALESGSLPVADAASELAELERSVSSAAYFLPAFDLRQATLALGAIRERLNVAAAQARPRSKFAFSRRPSASAAAAAEPREPEDRAEEAPSAVQRSGRTISGLKGATITEPREGLSGQDCTLADLEDCTVFLPAPIAALFIRNVKRCRVYAGPVGGAAFVEGSEGCAFHLAARQARIHHASATDFYLRTASSPIIEHSAGVRFAPYAFSYEGCEADLAAAGLSERTGIWADVQDFGWLRAAASPNWSVLPETERALPKVLEGVERG
jgi:tubulin-specific chaperone C